jgi:hypothetical protein
MGLSPRTASSHCREVLANAKRYGGTVVINWHDRSLAPERLWGRSYRTLVEEVGQDGQAWFGTAAEAVTWFRWRRSIRFERRGEAASLTITVPACPANVPAAVLKRYRPTASSERSEEQRLDGPAVLNLNCQ